MNVVPGPYPGIGDGTGRYLNRLLAKEPMRSAGTRLFGNGARVSGSVISRPPSAEKSPLRCSAVGSVTRFEVGCWRMVVPCQDVKKKVRFFPLYRRGADTGP